MSIRQQVMDQLKTTVQGIRVANGYSTDAGAQVHEWFVLEAPPQILPAIAVNDVAEQCREEGVTLEIRLTVAIIAMARGPAATSIARSVANDITRAIGRNRTLGGLVDTAVPTEREMVVIHHGDRLAFHETTLVIEYREAYPPEADPSTLDDFVTFHGDYDLAPSDGQIDATDIVTLPTQGG